MKKGEIYEGIIEKVDFPNKGYVLVENQKVLIKNGSVREELRGVFLKSWRNHRRRQESQCAVIFRSVADVCIRPCRMRISLR